MGEHTAPRQGDGEYRAAEPEPLGPDSLTWRYIGDYRATLLGLWAGSMQNMHPQLGAAVAEFSDFFSERFARLYRSVYPINGVVYDGHRAQRTAHQIRGYHTTIKGVDEHGRRFHGLDPEVFYWAHATFFLSALYVKEYFGGGATDEDKRRMFDEHVQWYRLYGMTMRPVPASWEEFQEYYDRMCREVLEPSKPARDVLDLTQLGKPPAMPWLPTPVWKLLRALVARGFVWLTIGIYHPAIREKLGYTWTERDARLHRMLGRAVHLGWKLVPFMRRYHPRARAGWRRVRGEIPQDAPLVETPRRNLPPPSERGKPYHYSPDV